MALLVFLLVILAVGAWVCAPIISEGIWKPSKDLAEDPDELRRKRDNALRGLRDLEVDREMGRVEEDDYKRARAEYEAEAVEAIQSLDSIGHGEQGG